MSVEDLVVEIPEDLNAELAAPEKEGEEKTKIVTKDESPLAKQLEGMKQREKDAETARLAAESRAREEAARAARAEAENQRLSVQAAQSDTNAIARSIEAKQAEVAKAEDEYRIAMESGNYGEAAKVQTRLSKAAAHLARLEIDAETRKVTPHDGAVRQQAPVQPSGDPLDRHIDNMQTGDRAKAWLRAHKECLTDSRKYNLMVGAHQEAVDKGMTEGGDNYFEYLETKLGYRDAIEPDDGSITVDTEQAKPTKRVLAAAPVSRDATQLNGSTSRQTTKVTLSADEKEAADFSGVSYAEYARQKLIAIKNGDFERNN